MGHFLFSIDGISGTGKSTIMRYLMGALKGHHYGVVGFSENLIGPQRKELADEVTRIRSLTDIDEVDKAIMLDRAFTQMAASDRAYLSRAILPIIAQTSTEFTIMDRWIATNMAYQSLNGITPEEILAIHREMEVVEPDVYIILTCDVNLALERVSQRTTKIIRALSGKMSTVRGADGKIDKEKSLRKMEAIQNQFLKLPTTLGEKCFIVDTSGNEGNIEQIVREILVSLNDMGFLPLDVALRFTLEPHPFDHKVISG